MSDMVIHEVYFGKTKELLQIESLIGEVRDKYGVKSIDKKDGALKNYVYKGKRKYSNSSPEMLKINRLFEKAFGFESFFLMIIHMGIANAFTAPVSGCLDSPEDTHTIEASMKGFKKTGKDKTFVCIFDGLFFNPDLTNAEVLGIILHEIGHNFQTAISPVCRGFSYIDRIMRIITIPITIGSVITSDELSTKGKIGNLASLGLAVPALFDNLRGKIIDNYKKVLQNDKETIIAINDTNLVTSAISGPIGVIKDIKSIAFKLAHGILSPVMFFKVIAMNIGNIALSGMDERGEIIADRFATAYGYGAECQSAMYKARKQGFGMPSQKVIREIPILNVYYDLISLPYNIIGNIIDCHPNQIYRSKDSLDFMEKELKKEDIDPKLRAEMQQQINKLRGNIKDLTDITEKGFFFTNAWSAIMLTLFNGDPKAVIAGIGVDKDFDNAFNNNLEMVKRAQADKRKG